ncbi:MAG: acetyl-CoA C-acyltransferase [Acidimicrobiales bacterium]
MIVDAVRTAVDRRYGVLSGWHPADLLAHLLTALPERTGLDPARVDDVVVGCGNPIGAQAANVARAAVLAAGWPEAVAAVTVEAHHASGLRALELGGHAVRSGAADLVVVGGVEVSSLVPAGAGLVPRDLGSPFPLSVTGRYDRRGGLPPPGVEAEQLAARRGLTRADLDAWSAVSRTRAAAARQAGRFDAEIVPVPSRVLDRSSGRIVAGAAVTVDPGSGPSGTGALAALPPLFRSNGVITAGNRAVMGDGAAVVVLAGAPVAARLGLPVRARLASTVSVGVDPTAALGGTGVATDRLLRRASVRLGDLGLVELDESYAAAVLAWWADHPVDGARLNPTGGALATGHPGAASGVRSLVSLVHGLARTGNRKGLVTAGGAGGVATAALVERSGSRPGPVRPTPIRR